MQSKNSAPASVFAAIVFGFGGSLLAGSAFAQAPSSSSSTPLQAVAPSTLAATVEELLAIDAKAALVVARQAPVPAGSTSSAAVLSKRSTAPDPDVVEVDFIRGVGGGQTAGLLVNGIGKIVKVGDSVGAYSIRSIAGRCIVALRDVASSGNAKATKRAKVAALKPSSQVNVVGEGKTWCFKDVNRSEMASSDYSLTTQSTVMLGQTSSVGLPRLSPLPVAPAPVAGAMAPAAAAAPAPAPAPAPMAIPIQAN